MTTFLKMHGLGNDFVIFDARTFPLPLNSVTAKAVADRKRGVGCDQVIVMEPAKNGSATLMRIFNADGGEVESCGNAARCVAYLMMMSILILPRVTSVDAAVILLCVYIFGLGAWLANQQAFKQEVARGREATVAGLVGFAETIVAAFVVQKVGSLVQGSGGFNAVFLLFGSLFTFSLVMVFAFLRPRWVEIK